MSNPYRLVVFDWEGTLGDVFGSVLTVLKQEAARLEYGHVDACQARSKLTLGLPLAIRKLFPDRTPLQQEQLFYAIQQSMATQPATCALIPGAFELLLAIRAAGIDLAIASNKGERSLARDIELTGLTDFFVTTRAASQAPAKPCPQMLEEIMAFCQVEPRETLMIGDSVTDIEMATAIQVDSIGVNFCFQPELRQELLDAGARAVFDSFEQLGAYLHLT